MYKAGDKEHWNHHRNGNTSTLTSFHPPWRGLHIQLWQTSGRTSMVCYHILLFWPAFEMDLLGSVAPPNLPYQSTFKTINLIFPSLVSWSPESTSILPLTAPVRASHCSCLLFMCQGRKYYVQMYRIFRDSEQAFGNSQIAISKQSENTQYVLKLNKEAGSSKACNVTQAIF